MLALSILLCKEKPLRAGFLRQLVSDDNPSLKPYLLEAMEIAYRLGQDLAVQKPAWMMRRFHPSAPTARTKFWMRYFYPIQEKRQHCRGHSILCPLQYPNKITAPATGRRFRSVLPGLAEKLLRPHRR